MRKALTLVLTCAPLLAAAQIEELENPGTVSAVQDRQYRMNHELSLGIGVLPIDAFYKGITAQLGYTYHFTDHFAWTVGRGAYSFNVNTSLRDQLQRDFGVLPTAFDVVNWMVGSDLIWSPFYGKLAYLNRSVLHFEAFLVGGFTLFRVTLAQGSTSTTGTNSGAFQPAANLGIGLRLFTSKFISWRLDVTDNVVVSNRISQIPTIQLNAALNFGASE